MLMHPTLDQLRQLRLDGMARALEEQLNREDITDLSFEDRLALLLDRESTHRSNKRLVSRLSKAKLRHRGACFEDLDFRAHRGLDRRRVLDLASCDWLRLHRNLLVTGATGAGKTCLACALAQKACRPPAGLFEIVETRDGRVPLWCTIPAGRFLVGSPEDEEGRYDPEGPQHEVGIASPFQLAAVPVTQAQYAAFDPEHRSEDRGVGLRPVESITWYQAMAFCGWLASHRPTKGARLPTEEEWAYACRAGSKGLYYNGNKESDLKEVAWYFKNSDQQTHDVGQKAPNKWGLYDMHGNVWEWTGSLWTDDHSPQVDGWTVEPASLPADLAEPDPRTHRLIRGGGYWNVARDARSAARFHGDPRWELRYLGFRVLLPCAPSEL